VAIARIVLLRRDSFIRTRSHSARTCPTVWHRRQAISPEGWPLAIDHESGTIPRLARRSSIRPLSAACADVSLELPVAAIVALILTSV
jgi:hypothetical protein